jgi:hypothetical protein
MNQITTMDEFAANARDIIDRFGLLNAVEISRDLHGHEITVFDLLEVRGCSEDGDEVMDEHPARWVVNNRHNGELIGTPDSAWALCCFVQAYVSLINEIEQRDAQAWEASEAGRF